MVRSLHPREHRRRLLAMALLVLSVTARANAGPCVVANLHFSGAEPPAAVVESMKAESTSIWASYGVRIAWSGQTDATACTVPLGSLDVVVDHRRWPRLALPTMPLGQTRISAGPIDHTAIRVDLTATEDLLGDLTTEQIAGRLGRLRVTSEDIGRALGRVLAHEIGHVLLAEKHHPEHGLMRPSFLAEDLIRLDRRLYALTSAEVIRLEQRERTLVGEGSG